MLVILFYSPLLFLYADRINKSEIELNKFRFHDALTGLFNQSYFQEEVSRMERAREYPVSILIADVDNMKTINDQYGRALGDLLLIQIAQTFATAFRANDVIARIGEDEFAVLLPATNRETAESLLRRVRQLVAERNKANPIVQTTLSLGIGTAQNALFLAGALKEAGENLNQNKSKTIPHGKKTIPTL
jgi:diguanylate cyclase (GGDEF)-like protein